MGFYENPKTSTKIYESGCTLTLHHTQEVYADKGFKHVIAPEHAQSVSIPVCDNALGQAIPPMVLCKRKSCQSG
jgi:hypothetical protein